MGTQKCANDTDAPPVPAVESTMDDLAEVMTTRCDANPDNIIRALDPADPMRMGLAVAKAAEQATDVLLVHYVGHGFLSADGELYLATLATDPSRNRLEHNSVRFDTIRRSLLNSRAAAVVVILDCCFSGRATGGTLSAAAPIDLADVHGGYILTAGARDKVALAPEGQRHTAFTGELIRLLRDGDPASPPELRMRHVYRTLDRRLRARSLPAPAQRNNERADDLVLATNAADGTSSAPSTDDAPSTGDKLSAAPRKRRLLPVLVIGLVVAAVPLVGLTAAPMLRLGTAPSPQHQQQQRPPQQPPPPPQTSSAEPQPPQTSPALPPPTTCAERRESNGCGELPAERSSLAADGSLVTLVDNPDHTVSRYRQSDYKQLPRAEGNIGGNAAKAPVLVPNARDRLIAFAIGTEGQLQYNPNVESDSAEHSWHPIPHFSGVQGTPAVAQDHEGKLVAVARDDDGALWRTTELGPGTNSWGSPEKMAEPLVKDDPVIHQDRNGALRIFALTENNKAYTWAQSGQDNWSVHPLGGTELATSPTVVKDGSDRLHLFARGTDNSLQRIVEQPEPVNTWPEDWEPVGPPGPYDGWPVAAVDGDDTVTVFVRRLDQPEKVFAVKGSGPDTGADTEIDTSMETIISVTLDRLNKLVAHGIDDGSVVTA